MMFKGGLDIMDSLHVLIQEISKEIPEVTLLLEKGADENQIKELTKRLEVEVPKSLVELYTLYNGEKQDLGFMAGFEFLSIEKLLNEYAFLAHVEEELDIIGTDYIQQKPIAQCKWVPLAFDASRCYIAMDLSPAHTGKMGQIISIDFDNNHSYLLAESLDDFFKKVTKWLQEGKLIVNKEEETPYITEKSGHLFNDIVDYAFINEPDSEILVPIKDEFWLKRYEQKLKKDELGETCVSNKVLTRETGYILIQNEILSCEPLRYMDNIKKVIIHNSELHQFECIAKMSNLNTICIGSCIIIDGDLSLLKDCQTLKELRVADVANAQNLYKLTNLPRLKSLSIGSLSDFDPTIIGDFKNLITLKIDTMEIEDFSFINKLTKLKKLNLSRNRLKNLDFLFNLEQLEVFELLQVALDEEGLKAVPKLTKLKEFIYPVRNLEIYRDHPTLKNPGFVLNSGHSFEVFAGTKVDSFTLIGNENKITREDTNKVAEDMGHYVELFSYGSIG